MLPAVAPATAAVVACCRWLLLLPLLLRAVHPGTRSLKWILDETLAVASHSCNHHTFLHLGWCVCVGGQCAPSSWLVCVGGGRQCASSTWLVRVGGGAVCTIILACACVCVGGGGAVCAMILIQSTM